MDSVLPNVISNFSDGVAFGIVIVLSSFKVNITLSSVSSTALKMPPACPGSPCSPLSPVALPSCVHDAPSL